MQFLLTSIRVNIPFSFGRLSAYQSWFQAWFSTGFLVAGRNALLRRRKCCKRYQFFDLGACHESSCPTVIIKGKTT